MSTLSRDSLGNTIKLAAYTLMFAGALAVPKSFSATTLSANGPGDTYELIESQGLGLETPDCGHSVRHIREIYDGDLDKYVFAFDSHRDLDDDRCGKTDRQRIEIKTAPPGNAEMQATYGETSQYRWKFKLPSGFQPSPSFTHIHQIKAYGGGDAGSPIFTITPRAGSPDTMQIIYTAPSGQSGSGVKAEVDLSPFVGTWVEAFVEYRSHDSGFIEVSIHRLSDGAELLSWNSGSIDTWRSGTTYNRGKWGIYRSLNNSSYLRDETVSFADWCFSESGETDCPSDIGSDPDENGSTVTLQENSAGFCSVDGVIESDHAGFTGSGYANSDNEYGSEVAWSVVAPQAGLYTLEWRFANGSSDRPANVLVNGSQVAGVTMAATGSWANYTDSAQMEVGLDAGYNTIRLQASGADGLANIDSISISGIDPLPGDCSGGNTISTLTLEENSEGFCSVDGAIESDHAGYNGSGYANTVNEYGSTVEWSVTVPDADLYSLQWRFANGAGDRPANVLINGSQAVSVAMAATGAWTNYADSSQVEVGLNSGQNTILLQAGGSSGLANIDSLSISGVDPLAADCNDGGSSSSSGGGSSSGGSSSGSGTPVALNGQLHVCGTKLCNQSNQPVQLRGMSTHGLQWYGLGQCVTEGSLDALADDWRSDILRVSLYVQEGGYETDPAGFTAQVSQIIDEVTERGMYVLVDWHQLSPGDPNYNLDNARQFFTDIAQAHAGNNNIIYDVANEPNNVSWDAIQSYAMQIIPVIRQYDPDAVVLVGTHGWASLGVSDGSSAQDIIDNPVTIDNTMYTFHFYAASHGQAYRNELKSALDSGLPIFVTEWGSQTYTGDGGNDFVSTQAYLDLLDQYQVSWTNWNYSDDSRSGAVWKVGTCSEDLWTEDNLKEAGQWVRDKIRNR